MRMESPNSRLFGAWRETIHEIDATSDISDEQLSELSARSYAIASDLLAAPAETPEDVWRLVLIFVDHSATDDDTSLEAALWRRAAAALGLTPAH